MNTQAASDPQPRQGWHASTNERRRRDRKRYQTGLAVSAAAHLVFFMLLPVAPNVPFVFTSTVGPTPDEITPGFEMVVLDLSEPEPEPEQEVVELVDIVTPPEDPPEDPIDPVEEEDVTPIAAPPATVVAAIPDSAEVIPETGGRSAAAALSDLRFDSRLAQPLPPELRELSDERRMQLAFLLAIRNYNDGVAAEEERLRAMTDWTFTDDEGRRWGVTPGQLHLGDVTVPLPVFFGASPTKQREYEARALDLADLNRAALWAEARDVRESLMEQALEKMRRDRAARDTTGVGGLAPTD